MSEPAGRDAVWSPVGRAERAARAAPLRLVADGGRLVADGGRLVADDAGLVPRPAGRTAVRQQPVRTGTAPRAIPQREAPARMVRPARIVRPARPGPAAHSPLRLTRRGRLAVTAAVVLAIGAVSMALAGAARATGHSGASVAPGRGVTKVEIRQGESLWSVAEAYDPNADTRLVIAEILQMNALNSDQVQPGQVLWVPRG